jgi:DUF438 domain-containing protein
MSELIDNQAQRVKTLKHIIKHLHAGQAPEQVKHQMRELVCQTDYSEIVAMEQELIADGMPVEEVRSMCDLHSQVTRDILVDIKPQRALLPGHPVDTFRRENEALQKELEAVRSLIAKTTAEASDADASELLVRIKSVFNNLMDIDKHYQRKEHALFSCMERHGITGPLKVMWAKDDDVRALLKEFGNALASCGGMTDLRISVAEIAVRVINAVAEMIYKEENILLPMALDTLTDNEWAEIWSVSPRYGWCLVEPREGYQPSASPEQKAGGLPKDGVIQLPTGNMTVEQLHALFSCLPLDLTFVDADDRVAFFTEGPDRIFPRSKAIIGRKVQHCHPPRSVAIVDRILADFRANHQSVAEFWIDFHGKFVHIRYFAVRNKTGEYLGTLELTQDIAPLRALEGERRLLAF